MTSKLEADQTTDRCGHRTSARGREAGLRSIHFHLPPSVGSEGQCSPHTPLPGFNRTPEKPALLGVLTGRVRGRLPDGVQHLHVSDVVDVQRLLQAHNEPLEGKREAGVKSRSAAPGPRRSAFPPEHLWAWLSGGRQRYGSSASTTLSSGVYCCCPGRLAMPVGPCPRNGNVERKCDLFLVCLPLSPHPLPLMKTTLGAVEAELGAAR